MVAWRCVSRTAPAAGWACGLSKTGLPGGLVVVSVGTLEVSLGVPGAGLRPGVGVLCLRDLGFGRRWRSGLVRCGILTDLGLPFGVLAGPVQFRAGGIRPPSAPGPPPARHSGRGTWRRPPGGPRR